MPLSAGTRVDIFTPSTYPPFPTPQLNAMFYFEFPLSPLTMFIDTCRTIQQNVSRNAGCRRLLVHASWTPNPRTPH